MNANMSTKSELESQNAVEVHPPIAVEYLPSSAAKSLEIVAANPTEYHQTFLLNAAEWKGPLNIEQYIEREHHLIRQDLMRDCTSWFLTDTSLPANADGSRPILASCETLQKQAYIARNGNLETVLAHGIASVYTRPEYRGRGYAARMMTELGKKLETWQQKNDIKGSFSILFSDIGRKFYARFGWKPFPSTHVHLDPVDQSEYDEISTHVRQILKKGFPKIEDLNKDNLHTVPAQAYVEAELVGFSELNAGVPHVAIRPDLEHFSWHHAREEIQCQLLGLPEPTIKGAIHRETGIAIIWSRVYASKPKEWSLHILHVAVPPGLRAGPTADDHLALSALLLRAQKEAHTCGMAAGVEVWDPSGFVISAAQKLRREESDKVEVVKRDKEHICSLHWIGAQSGDDPTRDIEWMHREKFCWC